MLDIISQVSHLWDFKGHTKFLQLALSASGVSYYELFLSFTLCSQVSKFIFATNMGSKEIENIKSSNNVL